MLLVGLCLRLGSEKVGETAKPFSNWLAIVLDAIVYTTWVKSRSLSSCFCFFFGSLRLIWRLEFQKLGITRP